MASPWVTVCLPGKAAGDAEGALGRVGHCPAAAPRGPTSPGAGQYGAKGIRNDTASAGAAAALAFVTADLGYGILLRTWGQGAGPGAAGTPARSRGRRS